MKKLIITMLLLLISGVVNAQPIDFEELFGDFSPVPNGYGGLNWNTGNLTGLVDVNPFLIPGVDYTGINNIAFFNAFGYLQPTTTELSAVSGTFDFIDGYWTAGVTGDVVIQFEGYLNGQLLYTSDSYNLNPFGVVPVTLNWHGLDSLHIISSSAVWVGDNLNINLHPSEVPLPAAVWLFGSALFGCASLKRRKKADA